MTRLNGPTPPKTPEDALLDDGFAALRAQTPTLPDGMTQRLIAHALQVMPPAPPATPRGRLTRILAQLGGWRAGLAFGGAAMAGLSLGFFDPGDLLSTQTGLVEAAALSSESTDIFDDPLAGFDAELGS